MVKTEIQETLERRAAKLGIPIDQLLEHDRKSLRALASSMESCIDPNLLQGLDDRLLEMLAHVANCPMCATLVDVIGQSKKKP